MLLRQLFHRSSGSTSNLLLSRDVEARWWLRWSGSVLAAVTLLSLAQDVYGFNLAPAAAYAAAALRSGLRGLGMLPEVFIIYLFIGLTLVRALYQALSDIDLEFCDKSVAEKAKGSILQFSNILVAALIWPVLLLALLYHKIFSSGEDYGILSSVASRLMRVLAVLLLIVAANALFPV